MPGNLSGRTDGQTDGGTCRKTVMVGRVDQQTHVQVKRGYFRLRTDGRTDGQPENIMPPAPKGGGIKKWTYTIHYAKPTAQLLFKNRFPDNIFKCIFLNENVWILIKISLKLVPKGPINNIPSLIQIMARHQTGNKPLSEIMLICCSNAYMRHSASITLTADHTIPTAGLFNQMVKQPCVL